MPSVPDKPFYIHPNMWGCCDGRGGALALVLHAHLPYVRSARPGSLEEDWFFQALLECYLPLLEVLEAAAGDPAQAPRITIGCRRPCCLSSATPT